MFQLFPVLSGILWGSAGVFVRVLNEMGMDSFTIVESRVFIAVIIIFAGLFIMDRNLLKVKLSDCWIFVCAGAFSMLGLNLCYNEAIGRLTLSLSAVLLSMSPLFVLALAAVIFKERLTAQKIFCAVLALIGCVLASGVLEETGSIKWSVFGILIGVLAAFFYGTYSIFSKIGMMRKYHSFTITAYSLLSVAVVLIPFTDWQTVGSIVQAEPEKMSLFLLVHSLCTSVLPYILFTVSLNYIEAGKVAILASGEPVAAMVFGILFYDEIPTVLSLIGLFTVLLALGLLSVPLARIKKVFS